MRATVVKINQAKGMVAVKVENGFSIFELLGDEVGLNDEIEWSGSNPLGAEIVFNHTSGRKLEVYFQNHHVHLQQLNGQLRL